MTYNIVTTNNFKKDVKHYRKKYKNITDDLDEVINKIKNGDLVGDVIPNIEMADNNNNIVKVRVANSNIPCGTKRRL